MTHKSILLTTLAKYVEDEVVKNFLRYVDYFFPSIRLIKVSGRGFLLSSSSTTFAFATENKAM